MLVGAEPFVERLQTLGFEEVIHDGDFYGFSLALGSAEVSLWQLTNAYRALANGGQWSPLKLETALRTAPTPVLDPAASWIVASMLSDPLARSLTFGLENPLASRYWTAVKTGTSKDMRDNWCVGFTERYTVGVWVGNFDGSPMHDVSGVSGAAPVWIELVDYLHRRSISPPPQKPQSVVARRIEFERDIEPAREEFFVAGTEIDVVAAKSAGTFARGNRLSGQRQHHRARSGHSGRRAAGALRGCSAVAGPALATRRRNARRAGPAGALGAATRASRPGPGGCGRRRTGPDRFEVRGAARAQ